MKKKKKFQGVHGFLLSSNVIAYPRHRKLSLSMLGVSLGTHEHMCCHCDSFILANQILPFNKYPDMLISSSKIKIPFPVPQWKPFVAYVLSQAWATCGPRHVVVRPSEFLVLLKL